MYYSFIQDSYNSNPFTAQNTIYLIENEVEINVSANTVIQIPSNCILRFKGDLVKATSTIMLRGNDTRIEAGLFQIFGDNVILDGTWIVETGYPEWWGAKSSIQKVTSSPFDCSTAIQAAFDSPIGHITFACGYYYVGSTLKLGRVKTITLQGEGQSRMFGTNDKMCFSSVLWTDQNINLLKLVPVDNYTGVSQQDSVYGNISIHGGAFDVNSAGATYNKSAILIVPNGQRFCRIHTTIIGPINTSSNTLPPFYDPREGNYLGNGLRIGYDPEYDAEHFYCSRFDLLVCGFGTGFRIDYDENKPDNTSNHGTVTSVQLYGKITNCIMPIYAPSRGFDGGEIGCDISSTKYNHYITGDGHPVPIIVGNMREVFLNPYIWDMYYGFPIFEFTNTDQMRFGPRMLTVIDRCQSAMGQSERRDNSNGKYLFDEEDHATGAAINRQIEYKSLTQLASIRGNSTGHVMGHLDPIQLGAYNAMRQASDYVHTIDNDLLSLDKVMEQVTVAATAVASVNPSSPDLSGETFEFMQVVNKSPLDPEGFLGRISNDVVNNPTATLTIDISFAGISNFAGKLQFLAIHLKGHNNVHFENLKVTIVDATPNQNTVPKVLYNGPYAFDDVEPEAHGDVIVPILPTSQDEALFLNAKKITIELKGLVTEGLSTWWWDSQTTKLFKMFIEGRFNRHFNQLVWTSGGGMIGNDITRNGRPYILGTKEYAWITNLDLKPTNPNDDGFAIGARGVVGSGNNRFSVVRTANGWIIENLVGTTTQLNIYATSTSYGGLTVGQQAFDTTLNKAVWWDGNTWV